MRASWLETPSMTVPGQGTFEWANGNKYIGKVFKGKRDGFGIMMFGEHDSLGMRSYSGYWVNDVPSGNGSTVMTNGEFYIGEIFEGKKNGHGTLTFAKDDERLSYTGDWTDDEITGQGIMTWKNKDTYHGDLINGKRSGTGIMKNYKTGGGVMNTLLLSIQRF